MLQISGVSFGYGPQPVLRQLSLELPAGQVHGLVGLNGSGKTTLLQLIAGRLTPQQGHLQWQGGPLHYRQVAFLETHNYFYHYLTGREYWQLFRQQNPQFDLEGLNAVFQLPLDQLIDSYSTGMKKKLAFAAVLGLARPLVILDEPFNGIDLEGSLVFTQALNRLRQSGRTVIITSHIFESLAGVCDTLHHLAQGTIAGSYTPPQFGQLLAQMQTDLAARHAPNWDKLW
jgi:ABC-2 type transport system ATP-binding protein